eukprot:SAG22_NODE_2173_length_2893_cov_3.127774_3_plen_131_part_00
MALGATDPGFRKRTATYSGMYMGDDELSPNYDKNLKLVRCATVLPRSLCLSCLSLPFHHSLADARCLPACRSIITGSKGPMLRKATGLDWCAWSKTRAWDILTYLYALPLNKSSPAYGLDHNVIPGPATC